MTEEKKPLKPLSKEWQEIAERFRDTTPSGHSPQDMHSAPPDSPSSPAARPAPVKDAPAADDGVEVSIYEGPWLGRRTIRNPEELDHVLDAVELRELDSQQAVQDEEREGQGPSPSQR